MTLERDDFEGPQTPVPHRVMRLVHDYVDFLGAGSMPRIEMRRNVGSRWLGRTIFSTRDPSTTTIQIQKEILDFPDTLERVVAHEVAHHAEFMNLTEGEIALFRLGRNLPSHGRAFWEQADRINRVKGEGFITETSDTTYALPTELRSEIFLLIFPTPRAEFGYGFAWTARITPKIAGCIERFRARGARLVRTRERRFAHGTKISDCGTFSMARDARDAEALRRLYDSPEVIGLL